jgi:hypothetical protein
MGLTIGNPPFSTVTKTHRRIREWFDGRDWVDHVRSKPSRHQPREVVVAVDTTAFFDEQYPVDIATLEMKFQPEEDARDKVRIQWIESSPNPESATGLNTEDPLTPDEFTITVGLHQHREDHHDDIEESMHFQIERPGDEPPAVAGYDPTSTTPIGVVDDFIAYVPYLVSEIRDELGGRRVD